MLPDDSKQIVKEQEYDVNHDILKWYKEIYSDEGGLGCYFDLENPCNEKVKRVYYRAKDSVISDDYAKQMDISGDIIFNFSLKGPKGQSRYEI